MANIIDYVERRGGVPFAQLPLTEVDALVLSTLAYMPLGIAVSGEFDGGVPLSQVAQALLGCDACSKRAGNTLAHDRQLLRAIAKSERFGGVRATGFVELYDEAAQEQFSAVTFLAGDEILVAFRGTDGTIVGWKEDFNMSFEREVPAQRSAVDYAQRAHRALGRPMTLAGHSKGGNLAAYAALFADDQTRRAIRMAYNFDGPGFNDLAVARRAADVASRIRTIVPQGSLVGMLLWHSEPFSIVHSDGTGVLQHDPYTWQVMGGRFVPADTRSLGSRYADATVRDWLANLPTATRKKAIDGIYELISSPRDRELSDLLDAQSLFSILHRMTTIDGETRRAIEKMIAMLALSAAEAVPGLIGDAAGELGAKIGENL